MARYAEQYSEAHGGFGSHVVRKQPAQIAQRPMQQNFKSTITAAAHLSTKGTTTAI